MNETDADKLTRTRRSKAKELCSALRWGLVRTTKEYEAIVALRIAAYARAGKINSAQYAAMRDHFDTDARIVAAWHGQHPVASLRIMAHRPGQKWEHDPYVDIDSSSLPPREETAEVTRVCVQRSWSSTGVSLLLFQHTALEVLRCGRCYVLGSSTKSLLPMYSKIGCKATDLRFRYDDLGGSEHTVFTADVVGTLLGECVPSDTWSALWAGVYQQAVRERLLDSAGLDSCVPSQPSKSASDLSEGFGERHK